MILRHWCNIEEKNFQRFTFNSGKIYGMYCNAISFILHVTDYLCVIFDNTRVGKYIMSR